MDNAMGHNDLLETLAYVKDMQPRRRNYGTLPVDELYGSAPDNKFHNGLTEQASPFIVSYSGDMNEDRDNCMQAILEMGDVIITDVLYDFDKRVPFVFKVVANSWLFNVTACIKKMLGDTIVLMLKIKDVFNKLTKETIHAAILTSEFNCHREIYDNIVRLLKCESYEEYVSISFCDIAAIPKILRDMGWVVLTESPLITPWGINRSTYMIYAQINDRLINVYVRNNGNYRYRMGIYVNDIHHICYIKSQDDIRQCIDSVMRCFRGEFGYFENGRYYTNNDVQIPDIKEDEDGLKYNGYCALHTVLNASVCEINTIYFITFWNGEIQARIWYEPSVSPHCHLCVKGTYRTGKQPTPFSYEYHSGTFTEMYTKMKFYVDSIFDLLRRR